MENRKIKIIAIILLFLVSCNNYSQKKNYDTDVLMNNANCVRSKKIGFKNRLKMFPFENTSQILIVSHRTKNGMIGEELRKYLNSIKINQDTINHKEFEQVEKLNLIQIEKFTDIIFNYSHKGKVYAISDVKCYEPRNAFIFLDKDNKVLGFIEICFGCNHLRTSDKRIDIGDYCEQKYDLLKGIFRESGIKYGITEVE
ncbi:hypothetical protein [Flavobacterium luminosum]|uniref:Lipoprotein n=1 Tax=Flavobacterium luminosum TaxID=2949086 RepID=A0ABT0TRF7_9FLAO|nr:hypothetical protein [Flavobacterium sp. HXWNR70]MCL9810067.1 hypothetical protein [Flavobacterium sp. HXWNR70]